MNRDRAQPRPWQTDWLMLRGMISDHQSDFLGGLAKPALRQDERTSPC